MFQVKAPSTKVTANFFQYSPRLLGKTFRVRMKTLTKENFRSRFKARELGKCDRAKAATLQGYNEKVEAISGKVARESLPNVSGFGSRQRHKGF